MYIYIYIVVFVLHIFYFSLYTWLADMHAESRVEKPLPMYVPRDEQFEESKMDAFSAGRLRGLLHNLIPSLKATISAVNHDFNGFSDIDSLYSEGLLLNLGLQDGILKKLPLPRVVSRIQESSQGLLRYDIPKILSSECSALSNHPLNN